jgi:GntR family transcriptional regulator/MocR family aminotransferase
MYQSLPTGDQLPLAVWRKILVKNSRLLEETSLDYTGDAFGSIRLRKSISSYLRRARGVMCDWDQIAIFSGSQPALDLICRVLLDRNDWVAMEEPGYFGARRSFAVSGAKIIPVPVDEEGISVPFLRQLDTPPKLLFVTPSHQDPTGAMLSLRRRQELLTWAAEGGVLIIEDDNDCEYRHGGRTLPSLMAMDEKGSVIYLNTFWRTLSSLVRIGYMVVPRRLLAVFTFVKSIVERDFPVLEQAALAEFIEQGCLERHIHKSGALYRERWHALTHACTVHLKDSMALAKESGGMRVMARFDCSRFSNERIIEAACEADFPLFSSENYYIGAAPPGEFLIPFGQFDQATIARGVKAFAELITV